MHFGPLEIIIIVALIVLLFGARRLPDLARSIGQSMKEFRKGLKHDDADKDDTDKPARR